MEAVKRGDDWSLAFPLNAQEAGELDLDDPAAVLWREWPTSDNYVTREDGLVACRIFRKIPARPGLAGCGAILSRL